MFLFFFFQSMRIEHAMFDGPIQKKNKEKKKKTYEARNNKARKFPTSFDPLKKFPLRPRYITFSMRTLNRVRYILKFVA